MQSPIVIQRDKTIFNGRLKPFTFFGYDQVLKWQFHLKIDHNGKNIKFQTMVLQTYRKI